MIKKNKKLWANEISQSDYDNPNVSHPGVLLFRLRSSPEVIYIPSRPTLLRFEFEDKNSETKYKFHLTQGLVWLKFEENKF